MNDFLSDFYYGMVTNNDDPDNQGRVKVKIEVLNDIYETDWIPVLSFLSGDNYGAFFIPDINDQVIVGFMDSSFEEAFVLGGIWGDKQKPPETCLDKNKNNLKYIKSKSGNMIVFDDSDGDEKIKILSGDNTKLEIIKKDNLLNIETDNDIIIEAKNNLKVQALEIEIISEKDFDIGSESINIDANRGDINIASNNIKINAENIKLN
ncbi:MAG: hypothetical protein JXB50_09150 [Spirochaetes bacterium]|nr:hypothetical protein [Spirochaetota bacterium]